MADEFSERRSYNAVTDFVDANVARGLGSKIAFIDPDRSLTYGELQARSVRLANALRSLGLRREERVALLLHDTVDYPVAFWGTIRAGNVALPLNTFLNVSQYAYILADSRASALIATKPLAQAIWPIIERLPYLRTIILVGDAADGLPALPGRDVHAFEDVIAQASAAPFTADSLSDEVAFWVYTSGSTGDPKGVKHVHSNLMATAKLFGQGVLGITGSDVVHSAAKLFFSYGLGNGMAFPLSVGATTVLWPPRPSPDGVFEIMRKHRPTIFYAVPSLYTALLAHPEIGKGAGSDRLRICVSAGEALPAHIGERWREVVGCDVLDGIGSTEMLQTFLSNRPGDIRYGSTGKPVPGYEARIVDETGRELGAEEIGELIVRGPTAGEGYWNQRAKSRHTFAGEWTYTGDKYRRDAEGYYYYCGRTDDMFKASGMWVSPFDVEAALMSHPAVLEAAVIGKQDSDGLVKPKAFIVLKNGFSADEALLETLKAHVKTTAGPWKYPRWIELRSDLPRTATGKIQRFKLREEDVPAG
ncbi:MAG: benzoate-CoA ligase family protein [Rhizobiales bacterium]|nr:benzoate-CoA ligase family protein [Hyphomicrobiales bacterium]